MKRKKLLALLLASTLVMSNVAIANAEEAVVVPKDAAVETTAETEEQNEPAEEKQEETSVTVGKEDAETETTVEETKEDAADVEQVTETEKVVEEETIAETEEMVHIPDERFQSTLINQGLVVDENGNVKKSDMEKVTKLEFWRIELDLTGIEAAVNLEELTISSCAMTSEQLNKHIENLTKLKSLSLDNNKLTDVAFAKNMANLTSVDVKYNQITDFSALLELGEKNPELWVNYDDNPEEGLGQIFEKFELADVELLVGQSGQPLTITNKVFGRDFFDGDELIQYRAVDGNVEVLESDWEFSSDHIRAKAVGETQLIAKIGNVEKKINVKVVEPEPAIPEKDKLPEEEQAQLGLQSALNQGQIWNWEDGAQKVSGDKKIKNFVSYWVYRNLSSESIHREFCEEYYGIDDEGTLWNFKKNFSDEKDYTAREIAKDVRSMVHFERRGIFYIKDNNDCHMVYVEGMEVIDQFVHKDVETIDGRGHAFLKDGTMVNVKFSEDEWNKIVVETLEHEIVEMTEGSIRDNETGGSTCYEFGMDNEGNVWRRKSGISSWEERPYLAGVESISCLGYQKGGVIYSWRDNSIVVEGLAGTVKQESLGLGMFAREGFLTTDGTLYIWTGGKYEKNLEHVKQVALFVALNDKGELYEVDGALLLTSVVEIVTSNHDVFAQREDGTIWQIEPSEFIKPRKITSVSELSDFKKTELKDETGVTVEGLLESGTELKVEAVSGEEEKKIEEKVAKMTAKNKEVAGIQAFDISLIKDGKEVQSKVPLQLTLPVPENFGKDILVFHEKANGELEVIESKLEGKTVTLTAESFSNYILASFKAVEEDKPDDTNKPGGTDKPDDTNKPGGTDKPDGSGEGSGDQGNQNTKPNTGSGNGGASDSNKDNGANTNSDNKTDAESEVPKTADAAPIMLYVVIAFIALTGCVVIVRKKFVK